jgi:hypothetical protein
MNKFDLYETLKAYFPDDLMAFARKTDPQTSKEAAKTVDVNKMEQLVLDVIKSFPDGCISQDVESALAQYRASSITPRYRPLMKKGLIVDTGEKRPGFSGRNQRVMRAI